MLTRHNALASQFGLDSLAVPDSQPLEFFQSAIDHSAFCQGRSSKSDQAGRKTQLDFRMLSVDSAHDLQPGPQILAAAEVSSARPSFTLNTAVNDRGENGLLSTLRSGSGGTNDGTARTHSASFNSAEAAFPEHGANGPASYIHMEDSDFLAAVAAASAATIGQRHDSTLSNGLDSSYEPERF